VFEEPAGCKRLEVVGVMAVRHSEIVEVALRVHPEMEKLDTYAVELNELEVRPRREVEKKDIGEELKLMEEYHMADN
jgi:hypothetical protein